MSKTHFLDVRIDKIYVSKGPPPHENQFAPSTNFQKNFIAQNNWQKRSIDIDGGVDVGADVDFGTGIHVDTGMYFSGEPISI